MNGVPEDKNVLFLFARPLQTVIDREQCRRRWRWPKSIWIQSNWRALWTMKRRMSVMFKMRSVVSLHSFYLLTQDGLQCIEFCKYGIFMWRRSLNVVTSSYSSDNIPFDRFRFHVSMHGGVRPCLYCLWSSIQQPTSTGKWWSKPLGTLSSRYSCFHFPTTSLHLDVRIRCTHLQIDHEQW